VIYQTTARRRYGKFVITDCGQHSPLLRIYIIAPEGFDLLFRNTPTINLKEGQNSLFNVLSPGLAAIIAVLGSVKTGTLLAPFYKVKIALIIFILLGLITIGGISKIMISGMDQDIL
jgi:hypothetical protein